MSLEGRLRRLEEHRRGDRCPACGLSPEERRPMAVTGLGGGKRFEGDPHERCASCGRPLWCVIRVVYDGEGDVADA